MPGYQLMTPTGVQRREKGGPRVKGRNRESLAEWLELVPGKIEIQAEEQGRNLNNLG